MQVNKEAIQYSFDRTDKNILSIYSSGKRCKHRKKGTGANTKRRAKMQTQKEGHIGSEKQTDR